MTYEVFIKQLLRKSQVTYHISHIKSLRKSQVTYRQTHINHTPSKTPKFPKFATMSSISPRIKGILFASFSSLLWGLQVIILKIAVGYVSPTTIVWFRFLVAFMIIFLFYGLKNPAAFRMIIRPPVFLIFASLGLAGNYFFFLLGVRLIPPTSAQVIMQLAPILFGLAGFVIFKEHINLRQGIGFIIAAIGLALFYHENITNLIEHKGFYNIGVLWVVVCAVSWAIYAVFQKKLVKKYPPQQLNLVIFGFPILLFLPFAEFDQFTKLSFLQWLPLIYLGITTFLAYASLTLAFKYLEANKIGIIVAVNPIVTFFVMGSLAFLEVTWIEHERFTILVIFYAFLVIGGAAMAVVKRVKSEK